MNEENQGYEISASEAQMKLKKAQAKNTLFVITIVACVIGGLFYNNWKSKESLDYIDGNILRIARTGSASTGNIWKNDSFVTQLAWASLFETDAGFEEINDYLAEGYEVSPDGLTHKLTLKSDLFWSDGTPMTIDDVVYSIETFLLNSGVNTTINIALGKIKGVEEWKEVGVQSWENGGTHSLEGLSVDGNTLTIQLDTPYSAFGIALTQFIPIPEHAFKDVDPSTIMTGEELFKEPVSSGMYKADHIDENGDLVLTKNEYYHEEYSDIEKIVLYGDYQNMHISYYATSNVTERVSYRSMAGFKEYDVDIEFYRYFVFNLMAGFELPEMVAQLDENGNEVKDSEGNVVLVESTELIEYDENRPENLPMQDILVRQAISYALDRKDLLESAYINYGTASFEETGGKEYNEFLQEYNPEKARELLAQSSYDLSRPLTIGYYHTDSNTQVFLAKIKESLEEIGFTVRIIKTSGSVALYEQRNYDMYLKAYSANSIIDWYNEYLTSNDNLYRIMGTNEFDDLLVELDATTTPQAYDEVLEKIRELESSTMYKLPLVSLNDAVYINGNRISVPDDMEFGNVRFRSDLRLDEWYIKKD